jgi:hypothetical protein
MIGGMEMVSLIETLKQALQLGRTEFFLFLCNYKMYGPLDQIGCMYNNLLVKMGDF